MFFWGWGTAPKSSPLTRVEKNPFFFKKNSPPIFLGFFKKKKDFVVFLKKTEKPHSELFYSIMHYHYFQKYTIRNCYTDYGIQN